jgi:hypothetical protein|uniref:DUF3987 domain-containing protein n=1 Tax=Desulfobacca acetoxidans TaxID=60893 RepID=A0A7V6A5P4_9BACT
MIQGLLESLTTRGKIGEWPPAKSGADGSRHWPSRWPSGPAELDALNRALVTGLVLEAMLENPRLKEEPGFQGHRLKACLRSTLASQLAGHMSLASFHNLAQGLEHWFEVVFPLLANVGLAGRPGAPARLSPAGEAKIIDEVLLRACLERTPGLLPQRRHRKLDQEKLRSFLEGTRGTWFCLRDFEEYFQIGRKTAWEYVQKMLQAGLLLHNHGHSSAVRYRIAPRFLKPAKSSPADVS